jgi:hypothetical protein
MKMSIPGFNEDLRRRNKFFVDAYIDRMRKIKRQVENETLSRMESGRRKIGNARIRSYEILEEVLAK